MVAATQEAGGNILVGRNRPDSDLASPRVPEDQLTNSHSPALHVVVAESKLGMGLATPPVLETPLKDFHFLVLHVVVARHRLGKDPANPIVTRAHSHSPVCHVVAEESTPDMALATPPVLAKPACSH
jgi:hypothetical protein